MASAVMNGRLRSIPTVRGESLVSTLSVTLSQCSLSISSIHKRPAPENNDPSDFNRRSGDGAADAHVPLHHHNEGSAATHQSVAEGVPINNVTFPGEAVIDHCWWSSSLPSRSSGSSKGKRECCRCSATCDATKAKDERWNDASISILAVLVRCHNNTPTLNHASSSSSMVHIYFHKDVIAHSNTINNSNANDNGNDGRNMMYITSIETSYHATGVALDGNNGSLSNNNGVLVIARSSGVELHSLQPIMEHHFERHCRSCDNVMLPKDEATLEEFRETRMNADDGESGEEDEQSHLLSTPVRRSNPMQPTTPLAPKSLSKAFEDVSVSQSMPLGSPPRTILNPTMIQSKIPSTAPLNHHPPRTKRQIHCISRPIELLPSFCIHALHLSYPYLAVASGDRVGVWNVNSDFIFGGSADESTTRTCSGDMRHNGDMSGQKVQEEALWATALPTSSGSKNVHRRVTSMHMTPCGEAVALSCWDGSAFVYVAHHEKNDDSESSSSRDSLVTSWQLIGKGDYSNHPPPRQPVWEQPVIQNSTDGLFPTFVVLKSNNMNSANYCALREECQAGSLLMAVSTPGSDEIRCFDVFSGAQFSDFGNTSTTTNGEIHGLATVHSYHLNGGDDLVWITGKDMISSHRWPVLSASRVPSETEESNDKKTMTDTIRRMKQHSSRCLIAESTSNNGDRGEMTSKAWLCWHKVRNHSNSSSNNIPPKYSASWVIQLQWGIVDEVASLINVDAADEANNDFADSKIIPAPFLTESDVIDLAQASSANESEFRSETQSIISHDFFLVLVPSYDMLYVYAREHLTWKMIDLQENVDITEDIDASFLSKAIILDSWCFVILLDRQKGLIDVRVWDLGLIFGVVDNENAPRHCCIPIQHCDSISKVDVQFINGDSSSFAVSCIANKDDDEGLCIWEIECTETQCFVRRESFLSASSTFPLDCLEPTSFFRLPEMKDLFPEHRGLVKLVNSCGGEERRNSDLVVHCQLSGSAWLCIPGLNLWQPV